MSRLFSKYTAETTIRCLRRSKSLRQLQYRCLHISASVDAARYQFFNIHKPVKSPDRQDPDYFEKEADKLPLDDHYLDALKTLWEEKIGNQRELSLKAADSLVKNPTYGLPDIDVSQPRLEYLKVDALRDAPESVKKIFSIDMGERVDLTAAWKSALLERVKIHEYDSSSLQTKIAWSTACIRHWTALIDEHVARFANAKPKRPYPKWLAHRVHLLLGWRNKQLGLLRKQNEEEFHCVLKKLQIAYHVPKQPEHLHTRKAWCEFLLRRRCKAEKEKQLSALHEKLQDGREERVKRIDDELSALNCEQAKVEKRLAEIKEIEGKSVSNCVGNYEPKLVEEFTEIMIHTQLFYHPPPKYKKSSPIAT